MNKILLVNSSPHSVDSLASQLAYALMDRISARNPRMVDIQRHLTDLSLPALSIDYARAVTARQQQLHEDALINSEQLIAELEQSDHLIISTPVHNFTLPAALKLWIDYVVRVGRTTLSTSAGKIGLLKDRPTYIIVRSGSVLNADSQANQPDFLSPYLRHVLASIGIVDVHFFYLHGVHPSLEAITEVRKQILEHPTLSFKAAY